jgi:hypothetical protein
MKERMNAIKNVRHVIKPSGSLQIKGRVVPVPKHHVLKAYRGQRGEAVVYLVNSVEFQRSNNFVHNA